MVKLKLIISQIFPTYLAGVIVASSNSHFKFDRYVSSYSSYLWSLCKGLINKKYWT